jgi:hypothetical protein
MAQELEHRREFRYGSPEPDSGIEEPGNEHITAVALVDVATFEVVSDSAAVSTGQFLPRK